MAKYLIIEDNPSISKMLADILIIEGHDPIISNDGRNGLAMIENQEFDGVLLDIAMPHFSGLDVIDALEEKGLLKKNKIIILTASSNIDQQIDSLKERGVHAVLKKPVDTDLLLSLLNS